MPIIDIAIMGMEPGHETGLRAGTAGGNHNPFRVEILGRDLLQDFLRTDTYPSAPISFDPPPGMK